MALSLAVRSFGGKIFFASGPGLGCCQSKYVFKTFNSAKGSVVKHSLRSCHLKASNQQVKNVSDKSPWRKAIAATRNLTFATPFSFIHRHGAKEESLSKDVLVSIPKEVFQQESQRRRQKRFFIMEWLIKLWTNIRYFFRFIRLFITFAPVLSLYPITFLGDGIKRRWWSLLLFACEYSGPTFIKLGQWASTRRDLFDPEFCDLFSKLHYCTKVHSWHTTKSKIRRAFGRRWPEIFVSVERKPVGSGCIAQVY